MQLQAGIFLKSTAALQQTIFEDAIIFVAELNKKGAMGFIVNKPFGKKLDDLQEFKHSASVALWKGGPVDQEHLFFIHRQPELIPNGTIIANGNYLGGDFNEAVKRINNKSIHMQDIKIFVGYCGWDANELEAEIEEGSWHIYEDADAFTITGDQQ